MNHASANRLAERRFRQNTGCSADWATASGLTSQRNAIDKHASRRAGWRRKAKMGGFPVPQQNLSVGIIRKTIKIVTCRTDSAHRDVRSPLNSRHAEFQCTATGVGQGEITENQGKAKATD